MMLGVIEAEVKDEENSNPYILVHAISGLASKRYQTMMVTVYVKTKPLHILIDSGSIHNFLNTGMAKELGCEVEEICPMKMDVTNGSSLALWQFVRG